MTIGLESQNEIRRLGLLFRGDEKNSEVCFKKNGEMAESVIAHPKLEKSGNAGNEKAGTGLIRLGDRVREVLFKIDETVSMSLRDISCAKVRRKLYQTTHKG